MSFDTERNTSLSTQPAQDQHLDLYDFARILLRRRRLILLTVLTLTALAAGISYNLPKSYTAVAKILIALEGTNVVDATAVVDELPPQEVGMIETEIEFLTSRSFVGRIVDSAGLTEVAEFNPFLHETGSAAGPEVPGTIGIPYVEDALAWLKSPDATGMSDVGDSLAWLRSLEMPPWLQVWARDAEPLPPPRPEDVRDVVIDRILDKVKVEQANNAYVIEVRATSRSPQGAADLANVASNLYVAERLREKQARILRGAQWLAERVEGLRHQLIADEQAVAEYRKQHNLIGASSAGTNPMLRQLDQLNQHLAAAQAERAAAEARHAQLSTLLAEGIGAVVGFLSSPLLADLRSQEAVLARQRAEAAEVYGERHPRMLNLEAEIRELRERMRVEAERIVDELANELRVARAREVQLLYRIEDLGDQVSAQGKAAVELQELERAAAATQNLYNSFLKRYKEVEEQQEIVEAGARVISPAVPPLEPSFPRPAMIIGVGFAGSLMMAGILAVVAESVDKGVRDADRIRRLLGLRTLAMVPRVRRKRQRPLHRLLLEHPRSSYSAAVRSVQLDLALSDLDLKTNVVLVTSALPNEGKTTLALSLATAAACAGYRTAIVDLDLHRPGLQAATGRSMEGPGIVAYLLGQADLEAVARPDPDVPNLTTLLVEQDVHDPTQLVASPRLITLLRLMRLQYDLIILDTPPVLAVKDTQILTRLADSTLFVVRWQNTKEDALLTAMRILTEQQATIAGAVVTQVDLKRHAKGYYGDSIQYRKEYSKYYRDA